MMVLYIFVELPPESGNVICHQIIIIPNYNGGREFEGLEIHIPNLDEVITRLYRD